jgi:hypothetical protein
MTTNNNELHSKQSLSKQWHTLHISHEQYEHLSLIIKLVAIIITAIFIGFGLSLLTTLLIAAVFWLQEGIWKTFQARACNAIIELEEEINNGTTVSSYQLYSHWQTNRPSSSKLVAEYITNALKPTVMFPYAPLMVIACITSF